MKRHGRRLSRRGFLAGLGLAGLALAGVGAEAAREVLTFAVRREQRAVAGLRRPLRAVVLTDFHLGFYAGERRLAGWLRAAAAAEPDVVLLVGDLVDEHYRGDLSELRERLPALRAPLGQYVVPGNHDLRRYPDLRPWTAALRAAGYRVLRNDGLWLRDDVYLAGVDDFVEGAPDVGRALAGAAERPGAAGRAGAAGRPVTGGAARLLMTHNPDLIPELPADLALVLAGHTHGGQVCIPGIGPLVTASSYGRRFASGWVRAPMPAFVSRGLGVSVLPVRLDCPAEVVVLDLRPA